MRMTASLRKANCVFMHAAPAHIVDHCGRSATRKRNMQKEAFHHGYSIRQLSS